MQTCPLEEPALQRLLLFPWGAPAARLLQESLHYLTEVGLLLPRGLFPVSSRCESPPAKTQTEG